MTPEEEEQVRRALASAPPVQPMPSDVSARLEARLAELQAERDAGADPAETDADRSGEPAALTGPTGDPARRNRRWPTLLVAAALLLVVGAGLGSILDDFTGAGGMDSMTAGEEAADGTAEEAAPRSEAAPDEEVPLAEAPSARGQYSAATGRVSKRMVLTAERVELRSESLEDDVVDFLTLRLPRAAADDEANSQRLEDLSADVRLRRLFAPCQLPSTRNGDQLVAVQLDGAAATMVLREPRAGARVAEVYSCDEPTRLLARTEVDPS